MLFDGHSRTSCQDDGIQILASAGRKSRAVAGTHLFLAIRITVALLIGRDAVTGTGSLAFRRANPIHIAVGIHREAEDVSRAGMSEWLGFDRSFAHDGSGEKHVSELVGRDASSLIMQSPTR